MISLAAMMISFPAYSMTPRMSSSRRIMCSTPSILMSLPEYLANRIFVARLDFQLAQRPVFLQLALTDSHNDALLWFFLGRVGDEKTAGGLAFFLDALDQKCDRKVVEPSLSPPCS